MKSIYGYLKLNANTLGVIAENYDLLNQFCTKKGLTLINLFKLDTYILSTDKEESKLIMDEGNYLSVHIDSESIYNKFMYNSFEEISLKVKNKLIYDFLEEIVENLNLEGLSLTHYLPKVKFKNIDSFARNLIEFKNKEEIIKYCIDVKSKFNPSKEYDFIYPTVKSNTQKVRKKSKMGIIDSITGKEIIPCKYSLIQGFDYILGFYGTPIQKEKFKGKAITKAIKDNYLEPCFLDKEGNIY